MRLTFCGLGFALVVAAALNSAPIVTAQEPASRTSLVIAGANHFAQYCVACHGQDGKGTGPLAATLKPKPSDLTGLASRNGGTYPSEMVFQIIDGRKKVKGHGNGDMPEWGPAFLAATGTNDAEAAKLRIEALVLYLETRQVK
jgi:mono/diheme cytochrome c family protein